MGEDPSTGLGTGTAFGGTAGRALNTALTPEGLLRLMPPAIVLTVLSAVVSVLGALVHVPLPLTLVLATLATAPVLGRLTVAASQGNLTAGLLTPTPPGAVMGFTARYVALTAAWEIPLSLLVWLVISGGIDPRSLASAKGALLAIGALVVLAIAIVAPVATLLVATRSRSVGECFRRPAWDWLWARHADFPIFIAALLGGALAVLVLVWIPFLLLGALVFQINARAGYVPVGLGYLLSLGAGPVLLARLAGAFVLADGGLPAAPEAGQDPEPTHAPAAPTTVEGRARARVSSPRHEAMPVAVAPPAAPPAADLSAKLAEMKTKASSGDLAGAIALGEALRTEDPRHPQLLHDLAALLLKAGRAPAAATAGSAAISAALAGAAMPLALATFAELKEHRKAIKLTADEFDQLARALLTGSHFAESAWCFVASGPAGADTIRWHKGMVSVADAAAKAGNSEVAVRIYQHMVKAASGTPISDYCKQSLERVQARARSKPAAG